MNSSYQKKAFENTGSRFGTSADPEQDQVQQELLEGRNAVLEALKGGRTIDKLYLAGTTDPALNRIASIAKDAGTVVVTADRRKLDAMSVTGAHQGVIAVVAAHAYADLDDIFALAQARGQEPLILVCDELSDPHNLGAVIRTAECAGAHGVIIPKRRSAGLTAVVAKAAAGAVEYLPIVRAANLTSVLGELKQRGVWVYGAAAEGAQSLYATDLTGPAAIVIGSEGSGLGRLIRDTCDVLVSIPMFGKISSLNASVAAAVLTYEAVRQRIGK